MNVIVNSGVNTSIVLPIVQKITNASKAATKEVGMSSIIRKMIPAVEAARIAARIVMVLIKITIL